jgi:putative Holliday junction resolvase
LEFLDERLTSVLAQQTLRAQGIQPSRHKELVDQAAAKRILQDYLDRLAFQRQRASDPEA